MHWETCHTSVVHCLIKTIVLGLLTWIKSQNRTKQPIERFHCYHPEFSQLLKLDFVRSEVPTAVGSKKTVLWDVTLCSVVDVHQCCSGTCCFHLFFSLEDGAAHPLRHPYIFSRHVTSQNILLSEVNSVSTHLQFVCETRKAFHKLESLCCFIRKLQISRWLITTMMETNDCRIYYIYLMFTEKLS